MHTAYTVMKTFHAPRRWWISRQHAAVAGSTKPKSNIKHTFGIPMLVPGIGVVWHMLVLGMTVVRQYFAVEGRNHTWYRFIVSRADQEALQSGDLSK